MTHQRDERAWLAEAELAAKVAAGLDLKGRPDTTETIRGRHWLPIGAAHAIDVILREQLQVVPRCAAHGPMLSPLGTDWRAKARSLTLAEQYLAARKRAVGPARAKLQAAWLKGVKASSAMPPGGARYRALLAAVKAGNVEAIDAALEWPTRAQPLITAAVQDVALEVQRQAGAAAVRLGLGASLGGQPYSYDVTAALEWLRGEARESIAQLANVRRKALRTLLEQAVRTGASPTEVALDIVRLRLVGLRPDQIATLARFKAELKASGVPREIAARRLAKRSERALNYRIETIALDQTGRAYAAGQRTMWRQAVGDGLITPRSEVEWVVVDPCSICEPLAGVRVPVGQRFPGGRWPAEVHPRCECMAILHPVVGRRRA